jgi:quercetin dioxygenase-like cupin family protein
MTNQVAALRSVGQGDGRPFLVGNLTVTFTLTGEMTGGGFALAEMLVPPGSGNMPLHTHPAQETLYVLEGEFAFLSAYDAPPLRVSAGGLVHVPADAPHGFINVGGAPGRLLVIAQPAGILEPAVQELGVPLDAGAPPASPEPPDLARVMAVWARYGWRMIPPS